MNKTNRSWGIAVAITLLVALGACSKVNNEFGDEFIPDDQKMQVFMDTIYGINTYLTESDSFPTSGMTYGFMGSCVDPTFGHTEASFCSQYMLSYFTSEEEMFGIAPVFDSLELSFTLNAAFWGDTTQKQTFQIFEMKDRLYYDTVYYADIDLPHMIEAEPIAEFTLSGCPTTEITLKLDSERAIQFAHHLMDTTGGSYTSDSLFFDTYKGLYFARKAGQNQASTLYRIVLSGMEMTLYTRSFTDASATQVKDTIQTYYAFGNSSSLYYNSHANRITHDYTGTPIQRINDTLPASEPMEFGYIQTLGGVATYVRFTDQFIKNLQAKLVAPYTSMVINRASLVWDLEDPTPEKLTESPSRIGAYSTYRSFTGIPDYDYSYESSAGVTLMYDGYLNRTFGNYSIDISIFLQKLLLKPESAPRTLTLGPGGDLLADFNQTVLKTGASDPPLRVALTYTLIR